MPMANNSSVGGRDKRPNFGKKRLKTDQKIAKKKTLADQFLQIFRKKQTSPDQFGLKNMNAKSDANFGNFDENSGM